MYCPTAANTIYCLYGSNLQSSKIGGNREEGKSGKKTKSKREGGGQIGINKNRIMISRSLLAYCTPTNRNSSLNGKQQQDKQTPPPPPPFGPAGQKVLTVSHLLPCTTAALFQVCFRFVPTVRIQGRHCNVINLGGYK